MAEHTPSPAAQVVVVQSMQLPTAVTSLNCPGGHALHSSVTDPPTATHVPSPGAHVLVQFKHCGAAFCPAINCPIAQSAHASPPALCWPALQQLGDVYPHSAALPAVSVPQQLVPSNHLRQTPQSEASRAI